MMSNIFYTASLTLLFVAATTAAVDVKNVTCPTIIYKCPANSQVKPNATCVASFQSCFCNVGFKKNEEKQVCDPIVCPLIYYECPPNSYRKPDEECLTSFDDCACKEGYMKNVITQTCITKPPAFKAPVAAIRSPAMTPIVKPLKNCTFVCPPNSYREPDEDCWSSFDDCECKEGFAKNKTSQTCIMKPPAFKAPVPIRSPALAPIVTSLKNCTYVCPPNSYRDPDEDCWSSFDDCECKEGFAKNRTTQTCIVKAPAPIRSPFLAPVKAPIVRSPVIRSPTVKAPVKAPTIFRPPVKAPTN